MSITFRGGSSHPRSSCGKEACRGPGKLKWGFAGVPPAQTLPHPLQTACFPPNTAKTSLARSRGLAGEASGAAAYSQLPCLIAILYFHQRRRMLT